MNYRALILLVAALSMVGCTTMRPVETDRVNLDDVLKPGDHVVVFEKSGRIVDMTISFVDAAAMRGELTDGTGHTSVAVDDIEQIEVEKVDGVKTVLAVIGGTVVIVPLAVVALLIGAGAQGYSP